MKTITSILLELGTKIQQNIDLHDPAPVQPRVRRRAPGSGHDGQEMQMQTPLRPAAPTPPKQSYRPHKSVHAIESGSETSEHFVGAVNPLLGAASAVSDQLSYLHDKGDLVGMIPAASTAAGVAGVTTLLGAVNSGVEIGNFINAVRSHDNMTKVEFVATLLDGVERTTTALANTAGSTALVISHLLDAVRPGLQVAKGAGDVGGGMLSGLGILSGTMDLYDSILEAIRYGGVRKTSLALLAMLNIYNSAAIEQDLIQSNPVGFKSIFRSEASIKKSFLDPAQYTCPKELAHYYWFCFKYQKSFFGQFRFAVEKFGLPLISLAAACLSIAIISTTVSSGGITLVALGSVAAAGGVLFSGYRIGKYAQSVSAFQDEFARFDEMTPLAHTPGAISLSPKEIRQISECIGFTHRVFGAFAHKIRHPIAAHQGTLRAPGVTLGDWYRFKLAQALLELVYERGTDDTNLDVQGDTKFRSEPGLSSPPHISSASVAPDPAQQDFSRVATEMKFLFARGVWEVIKSDLSEHAWRLALQDIDKLLPKYVTAREAYVPDSRLGNRRLQGAASPRRKGADDFIQLGISDSLYEKGVEKAETPLLKVFFGMLRVNA